VRTLQVPKNVLTQIGALLAAAIAGGAVAVGGTALLLGVGDDEGSSDRTVTEAGAESPDEFRSDRPMSLVDVYRESEGGVVQVSTTGSVETRDFFSVPPQEQQRGSGSGFVLDKSGHIVTNFHVIEGASEVEVSVSNGEEMEAAIVGRDPSTDIAVLRVDAETRALSPLDLGNSDALEVGDEVVAIGNPLGYERTMTAGIVSALGRVIESPNQFAVIDEVIQTDAPINSGNSGGPLLNAAGQVVGVNTQIATAGSPGNIGIGFAVPVNTVKDVTAQLIASGRVEHSFLGVEPLEINEEIADMFNLDVDQGLLIASVTDGSAAERAGLRGGSQQVVVDGTTWVLGGDIILAADGTKLRTVAQLRELIEAKDPGDEVTLEIRRDGETRTVTAKLGRRPTSPQG
jgi:S1-C subfamily serine protease